MNWNHRLEPFYFEDSRYNLFIIDSSWKLSSSPVKRRHRSSLHCSVSCSPLPALLFVLRHQVGKITVVIQTSNWPTWLWPKARPSNFLKSSTKKAKAILPKTLKTEKEPRNIWTTWNNKTGKRSLAGRTGSADVIRMMTVNTKTMSRCW